LLKFTATVLFAFKGLREEKKKDRYWKVKVFFKGASNYERWA